MKVIGSTEKGFLLSASEDEIRQILKTTIGEVKEINIGINVPALDYAESLKKIKKLAKSYSLQKAKEYVDTLQHNISTLNEELELLNEVNHERIND